MGIQPGEDCLRLVLRDECCHGAGGLPSGNRSRGASRRHARREVAKAGLTLMAGVLENLIASRFQVDSLILREWLKPRREVSVTGRIPSD